MQCVIAGSRSITSYKILCGVIDEAEFEITSVISGRARGVDRLGEQWAKDNNIPVIYCPANWGLHGKRAGFVRNSKMVQLADCGIILWDGKSKGSRDTLVKCWTKKIPVFEAQVVMKEHYGTNA